MYIVTTIYIFVKTKNHSNIMKKTNQIISAVLIFMLVLVTSCSSDDGVSNGTSTGNYWPLAVNNTWTFSDGSTNSDLKVIGTTDFSSVTYFEMFSESTESQFNVQNWIAKKGGTYYQKVAETNINNDGILINIKGYEVPLFKDNLDVNGTWVGSVSPKVTYTLGSNSTSIPAKVKYTGTIVEKDATVTLNSQTYTEVIKMKMKIEVIINGQTTTSDIEYWFAKDVGPIREYQNANGAITESTLVNYVLN
jgi:hypothetical protein